MPVVLLAAYEVTEPDRFIDAFDAFAQEREAAGATTCCLVESAEDPRRFVAILEFGSRAAAESFATSAGRLAALERGGVTVRVDEFHDVVRPLVATAA